jgi:hypothetical protein
MSRYVPQHLFDGLVVERLLADLAADSDIFDDLIDRYRDAYPEEDVGLLVADVNAAAAQMRKLLADSSATGDRDELAMLQGLLGIITEEATRDKPLWRRMVENYFFNVQSVPIPDRVRKACEHLVAARKVLLARDQQVPVA